MSTCYYMACEKCREYYWVAQDGMSGFHFYSREPRCMEGISAFLGKHVLCGKPPVLMSEHYLIEQEPEWKEIEWPLPPKGTTE